MWKCIARLPLVIVIVIVVVVFIVSIRIRMDIERVTVKWSNRQGLRLFPKWQTSVANSCGQHTCHGRKPTSNCNLQNEARREKMSLEKYLPISSVNCRLRMSRCEPSKVTMIVCAKFKGKSWLCFHIFFDLHCTERILQSCTCRTTVFESMGLSATHKSDKCPKWILFSSFLFKPFVAQMMCTSRAHTYTRQCVESCSGEILCIAGAFRST